MAVRGIRGATTADSDSPGAILEATTEMLQYIISSNGIQPADVAAAWFTTTRDLMAEFPAVAARRLGWVDVPLMCGHEMEVPARNPRSIPRCVRVLVLVNTERPASEMQFAYLRGAEAIKRELDALRDSYPSQTPSRTQGETLA